jgi:bifunctional non-homologous end joining protein LigD
MPLETYKRKRDFGKTPEPAGDSPAGGTGRFVVQRHRATRLHYDFRLEIDGVLVSWAVPKGPTLDSAIRRMAVHVEDHPIEYFDFEGVIPHGQYGAGDVIVWDWGTWTPEAETPDPGAAIANGELKFVLEGQKVKGRFTIVRTSRRPGSAPTTAFEDDSEQWLLIKKRDAAAVPGWDAEDHPQSVRTGRTNDEVKANRDAIWISEQPAAIAEIDLAGAVERAMPDRIEPMAATLAGKAFNDPDWLFEIKWDGYRVEAVIRDGKAKLWTRSLKDAETYFPNLLSPPTWIDAKEAIVDGEVVALDEEGRPDFSLLQERISERRTGSGRGGAGATPPKPGGPLVYQVFDLLYLDGRSLLGVPLEDRKRLLRSVLRETSRVRYASHVVGDGEAFMAAAKARGLEGIVAKLRRSRYEPGKRTPAWLKLKIRPEQELVVGGWTPGEGNARDLGAVAVGVYEGDKLRFAGKVGSGFTATTRKRLLAAMAPLVTDAPPFDPPPPQDYRGRWGGDLNGVTWIQPELVIRAEIGGWTRDGVVRQTSFKAIEVGRDPRLIVREEAVSTAEAVEVAEAAEPETRENPAMGTKRAPRTSAKQETAATSTKAPKPASKATTAARSAKPVASASDLPDRAEPQELEALATMPAEGVWHVGGKRGDDLKLTNLDKALFGPPPSDPSANPVTKRELIGYFARIAPTMLPHLAERPLNLQRFPNGAEGPSFWQKDIPATAPTWLRRWHEVGVDDRKANDHLIADRVATLCWLGNQAAFEVHAWTSRLEDPFRPTFALIDIDPGTKTTWEETLVLARLYRTALAHLGVRGYPKTTGKRGIQVWIPIEPRYSFSDTSDWVERISRAIGSTVPDLVSWDWAKANRGGKARLDYTQNQPIKTLVSPYAVRPSAGAPVSAPISWDELDDPDLRPDRWTIRTIVERVERVGDLFAGAQTDHQALPPV